VATTTTGPDGLTSAQVAERVDRGQVNAADEKTSRSFGEIARANVLTRFNAMLGVMLVLILVFGSPVDGLFGIVLVLNALIGIFQEVRAKRTLDRLAVLNAPRARAVRDGAAVEIPVEAVVLDDLLDLTAGDQVPADGMLQSVDGLEIDESLLTGESDAIVKQTGDQALSGSIVVAGKGRMQATAVGSDAYARKLTSEAKAFMQTRSEIYDGINRILKYITWALLVIGPILFLRQISDHPISEAVTNAVGPLVGMVPEGLVLLTSLTFLLAAVTLARRKVLVQELPAVEGLARVDVVCLDKTGTLTEGTVAFHSLVALEGVDQTHVEPALGALADDEHPNATAAAIGARYMPPVGWEQTAAVPFSSARKWSGATFGDRGTWVLGAPEMVWPDAEHSARHRSDEIAATGSRVLMLAHSASAFSGESLPAGLEPVSLVVLEEQVRPDAAETLAYFAQQGVQLKVISGDNPRTVGAVARRVGLAADTEPFDARMLPDDPNDLAETLDTRSVFGRVTPQQKRAMVGALQARGHVVAMTGDGVNDALALKDADIGVAMGSGAAATRAVAQIVLLDGRFATMPGVVAEGRRVIANIERVANLFLTKTTYASLIAVLLAITAWATPFLPRHLTVVSTLTIGVPAFFLALMPNSRRYAPGFVRRVLRFAVPAGLLIGACVFITYAIARSGDLTTTEARTASTIVLMILALYVLVLLARPLNAYRTVLMVAMIVGFVAVLAIPWLRDFYDFDLPGFGDLVPGLVIAVVGCVALEMLMRFVPDSAMSYPTEPPEEPVQADGQDHGSDGDDGIAPTGLLEEHVVEVHPVDSGDQ
jgi:cation-transporting ATPase E